MLDVMDDGSSIENNAGDVYPHHNSHTRQLVLTAQPLSSSGLLCKCGKCTAFTCVCGKPHCLQCADVHRPCECAANKRMKKGKRS